MSASTLVDAAAKPTTQAPSASWRLTRAKHAFQITLGKMLQTSSVHESDVEVPYLRAANVQWGRIDAQHLPLMWASPAEVAELKLEAGDLLVCEGGEGGRAARLAQVPADPCIIQNALHRVRGTLEGDVGFLEYWLWQASTCGWLDVLCNRATFSHFTAEKFRDLILLLPPRPTQQEIIRLLDSETARIDDLIAAKERMLALLDEKLSAIVSRVVTCGLDSLAPTKPSGVDWLGEIPAKWVMRRCSNLFTERDERDEPDLPLLHVSLNTGVTLRTFREDRIESVADDFATYKVARRGQLVFNKMRLWQGAGGIAPSDGLTSPDYTVAEVGPSLNPAYIELLVHVKAFNDEVRRRSHGMVDDRLRLYWDGFKDIRIPVPPLDEQSGIIQYALDQRKRHDALSVSLAQSIELLKERRSALITAAVSGDVPAEQAA